MCPFFVSAVYIVVIKSRPNWGTSDQIKLMVDNFKKAQHTLRTGQPASRVIAVNGCCIGQENQPELGDYSKLCGQTFWEFISGNENLYIYLVESLGYCLDKGAVFADKYDRTVNMFTNQFFQNFFEEDVIDWEKLVRFNSGAK